MNPAQPIRSEQELKDFMNFYEQVQYHPRNQLLLTMGLNTALRISDLLSLQWKQGVPPVLLMEIYHHSSFDITKRYLGIEQDDRDEVFRKICL